MSGRNRGQRFALHSRAFKIRRIVHLIDQDDHDALRRLELDPQYFGLYPNGFLSNHYTPLGDAICKGKLRALAAILDHPNIRPTIISDRAYIDGDLTSIMLTFRNVLCCEVEHRKMMDLLDLLLNHPRINVNELSGSRQQSAGMMAASIPSPLVLWRLMQDPRFDPNLMNLVGTNALWKAISYGNKRQLAILLMDEGTVVNGFGDRPWTSGHSPLTSPLSEAIFRSDIKMVRMLLASGADPNTMIRYHITGHGLDFYNMYILNLLQVVGVDHPETLKKKMKIGNLLREAGSRTYASPEIVVRIPRDLPDAGPNGEWTRLRALHYLGIRIPKETMSLKETWRFHFLQNLRVQTPTLTLRKKMVEKVAPMAIPVCLKDYLLFEDPHFFPFSQEEVVYNPLSTTD